MPLAPLGESVCGLQRAFHIQAVSRSPAVFTSHRAPSGPCVFEQPLGQAWVCGGLILPSVVSPFQDLPVNFLASPLGCGSPHLHLNLRLEELQVPIRGWHRLCPLLLIKPAPSGSDTDAFHGQQKCPSLLLFLPEAPKFLTNKRCSFCRLPLANFQSLENSCFWHFCLVLQLFFCKHYLSTSSFLHSWKSPASFKNAGRMTCLLLSKGTIRPLEAEQYKLYLKKLRTGNGAREDVSWGTRETERWLEAGGDGDSEDAWDRDTEWRQELIVQSREKYGIKKVKSISYHPLMSPI